MAPGDALALQIDKYRQMSGEERLKIALDMHTFARNLPRIGIRRRYPDATDEEVEKHLKRRIQMGRK